ncbi:sensor histidine kinase [Hymenobacter persicinus]|uniref:histidine kinase n=1 Tax=Hymenobacter persicinus TaxID=2025506 RepID=A0A4Q5L7I6_9BACT|nr:HAMP domain-containing sensor histidine kinase [Hymenobacter persicinus]RYU77145.1 HAMP domain-containing histidine kinase [Hymenobacter persicinus]
MLLSLLLGFVTGAALLGGLGWWQHRRTRRALAQLAEQVRRLSLAAPSLRLPSTSAPAETGQLIGSLNELLARHQAATDDQRRLLVQAAHKLRTPLTSITGQIEVTLIKARSVEQHEQTWRSVLQDVTRFNQLADDLLLLAQLPGSRLVAQPVALDEVIYQAISVLKARRPAYEMQLDFASPLAELPGPLTVPGDADLLTRALVHLLDNAGKFSPDQRGLVTLSTDGAAALLLIQDYGLGIPPAELPRVSELFFQGENARQRPGHGLGLTVAQRIVELHGGHLRIESDDAGTVVTVRLPLR